MEWLKHTLRRMVHAPGFTAITLITLALGIGANTAIFSVVNAVILRPLAYADPGRLVFITSQFPNLGFDKFWISPPEFVEFRDRNKAYSGVGAYRTTAVNLGTQEQPRRVNTAVVSSELMPVLGVAAAYGPHEDPLETLIVTTPYGRTRLVLARIREGEVLAR